MIVERLGVDGEAEQLERDRSQIGGPEMGLVHRVRPLPSGPGNWSDSVDAQRGDVLDWKIEMSNDGPGQVEDLSLRAAVPAGLAVIADSVRLYNSQTGESGIRLDERPLGRNGYDVGNYAPDSNAILVYQTRLIGRVTAGRCRALRSYAFAGHARRERSIAFATVDPC